MAKSMTNLEISTLLRNVAASVLITGGNRFQIIAYERAADAIEHLTRDVKDIWDDKKLGEIPGVGSSLESHLDELMRTGTVRHFESLLSKVPKSVFPLLLVPGIGPKKAYKLVTHLKLNRSDEVIADLEKAANAGMIATMEGFGQKSEADILEAIGTYRKGQIKEKRMELPLADSIALDVIRHLKSIPGIKNLDVLGSLRRQVSTIGDIDIAVATTKPAEVIAHFIQYPHQKLIEEGTTGASLLLHNGRQVDLRVQKPEAYGAMLQYFTGSKHHNIKLRTWALEQGKSLNEYGIKDVKSGKVKFYETEKDFYHALGLEWIPPEIREDKGEIEAALRQSQGKQPGLPKLVELYDLKGDIHIHTNYDLSSSHDIGADPLSAYLDIAVELGYEYIGLSDHNPRVSNNSKDQIVDIMKKRKDKYEQLYSSWNESVKSLDKVQHKRVQIFIMCEVDILPNGALALPDEAFEYVDAVIVSLHSSFTQPREQMTERVKKALTSHPKVRIFGHPTGRLLTKREGVDIDWDEIFPICKERDIALEINAYPDRLDLPDTLVFDARKAGVRFCIDTDSHAAVQMSGIRYGVSVARRGWCTKEDIVDTMEYNIFKQWLVKNLSTKT